MNLIICNSVGSVPECHKCNSHPKEKGKPKDENKEPFVCPFNPKAKTFLILETDFRSNFHSYNYYLNEK